MTTSWFDLLAAAFGGGGITKLLDYMYSEYKRRSEINKSAEDLINEHLDPILKAADELVGKISALAQEDFKGVTETIVANDSSISKNIAKTSVAFLFAQFWARIQILRIESLYVDLGNSKKGRNLLAFISTIESKKIALVDRAWQRGIGESIIIREKGDLRHMTFYEFMENYLQKNGFQSWFAPIIQLMDNVAEVNMRQKLLVYGTILHALIDNLDQNHLVTSSRKPWSNKLNRKSTKDLKFRVFRVYLLFIKNPERYYQSNGNKNQAPAER